jgi:PAS domain S-box-containing protein
MQGTRLSGPGRSTREHEIILLAAAAALFAWVMQAALELWVYPEKSISEVLFLDISTRELYSRVGITCAVMLSGAIISRAVRRLKRSEARARRLDKCVRSVRAINQLITRVDDRPVLCQRACEELVSGLRYRRVEVRLNGERYGLSQLRPTEGYRVGESRPEPVCIPIDCDGERFGTLVVTLHPMQQWDAEEQELLKEVAEDLAFSLRSMLTAENLRQQREEVQTILDSVSAYITYKDREGRYIRVNRALSEAAGVSQEDWVGRTLSEIAPGSDSFVARTDEEVSSTGKPRHTALEALELPSGTRWVQTDRVPYRDSSGDVIGVIALSVDITDRMEAERALACKDEQLRQSQKMEAIGQLAGGIAHDFNNLLTAISGYTELARSELDQGDPAGEMLVAVSKASDRAAALTRQLLAFSRRQPLWLAEQDLNEVISGTTDMLKRLIGEDIELVTELDDDVGRIDADASQMEQVLMNLAVNARDAMPHGGKLTISTSVESSPAESPCGTSPEAGKTHVCLRVSDTGCGMDSTTLSQIFEPFFTTKRPGVGTGLGLSVVDGIVEQHGGWIRVESQPEQGTSFYVYLPMVTREPETAQDAASEVPTVEAPEARGERVLLVEDEETVRAFASRALREWGYDVMEATSAEEAAAALEREPCGFDLVFSDIVLPGKSGTQLAEEISARDPGARVLLTSGYLFQEDRRLEQQDFGICFPLLKKPYSVRGLRAAVHEALCRTSVSGYGTAAGPRST